MRDVFHSNNWGGSRPGGGRPKGSIDSRPREIREAMIQGAINSDLGKTSNIQMSRLISLISSPT
jgi:hypothetical protein